MPTQRCLAFRTEPVNRTFDDQYATAMDLRVPLATKDERLTAFARAEGTVDVIW